MIRENFPKDPKERQVIVLMEDFEIVNAYKSDWIHSPNITVLEYPFEDPSILENELCLSLERANLIEQGAVLSRTAFDSNTYMNVSAQDTNPTSSLIKHNALRKYQIFATFCKKLGATRIYGQQIDNNKTSIEGEVGGKAEVPLFKKSGASMQLNANLVDELKRAIEFEVTGPGNPDPDIDDAWNYLLEHHLTNDIDFKFLLEGRTGSGKITSSKWSCSLTSETMLALKLVGGIKFGPFNADGNFGLEFRYSEDIRVSLEVEFAKG